MRALIGNIGFINHTQDLDGYVLLATYMWDKDNTVGANWTWAHSDGNLPSLDHCIPELWMNSISTISVSMPMVRSQALPTLQKADWQFGKAKGLVDAPLSDTVLTDRMQSSGVGQSLRKWVICSTR